MLLFRPVRVVSEWYPPVGVILLCAVLSSTLATTAGELPSSRKTLLVSVRLYRSFFCGYQPLLLLLVVNGRLNAKRCFFPCGPIGHYRAVTVLDRLR